MQFSVQQFLVYNDGCFISKIFRLFLSSHHQATVKGIRIHKKKGNLPSETNQMIRMSKGGEEVNRTEKRRFDSRKESRNLESDLRLQITRL